MSRSLDDINDEEWLANFGTILGGQVTKLYNEFPDEKVCDMLNACVWYMYVCMHVFSIRSCVCVGACVCVCNVSLEFDYTNHKWSVCGGQHHMLGCVA